MERSCSFDQEEFAVSAASRALRSFAPTSLNAFSKRDVEEKGADMA